MTNPHVESFPLPFPGAVDQGGGRATFTLYAPRKRRVELIGDLNRWERGADVLSDLGNGLWSVEKRLEPGAYRYQFVADDLVIGDPYARATEGDGDPLRSVVE